MSRHAHRTRDVKAGELMARIRSIHPDACVSETLAGITAELERTFMRLLTHCDDEGRCADNVRLIKAAIYPLHDDVTLARLDLELDELTAAGVLDRYEVDGKRCVAVTSWGEYQHPKTPTASKFPAPPEQHRGKPSPSLDQDRGRPGEGMAPGVGVEGEYGEEEGVEVPRSQLPSKLPDDWAEHADTLKLDGPAEFTKFANYNLAKGSTWKDWDAAWRQWCSRSVDFGRAHPDAPPVAARPICADCNRHTLGFVECPISRPGCAFGVADEPVPPLSRSEIRGKLRPVSIARSEAS